MKQMPFIGMSTPSLSKCYTVNTCDKCEGGGD